jgi:hypothetical protein
MASKNRYIVTLFISQFIILTMLGVFFFKLNQRTSIFSITQIIFTTIASITILLSIIDTFIVLIRKKNLDKMVFKLEANDKYTKFYRLVPSVLLIFAFLNLAVSRSTYVLSISFIMVSIALFCTVRGKCFPIGLSEKGLMFFGEIYNTDSITKCFIDTENKQLKFEIKNSIFGSNSMNSIILKFSNVSEDNLIAFLNKKKINIELETI